MWYLRVSTDVIVEEKVMFNSCILRFCELLVMASTTI